MNREELGDLLLVIACYSGIAALIAFFMYELSGTGSLWLTFDAERFHAMAEVIIGGFKPYIDFVDPKPPLLFFTVSFLDLLAPAGSLDIVVMSAVNVVCAVLVYLVGREDYGRISGFSAGFLFLVAAVFVQGYFLFSEQFAVLFIFLAFMLARRSHFWGAGLMLGLATGFKQYAFLALIPLLYMMRANGSRRYWELVLPALLVFGGVFAALFAYYGPETTRSALNWTFGIAQSYVSGAMVEAPTYKPQNILAFTANLLGSVMMVLPTLLFAAASIWRRGLRTCDERAQGLFVLFFLCTLFIRQYLHYWIIMLPFLALIACREFEEHNGMEPTRTSEESVPARFAGFLREVWALPEPEGPEAPEPAVLFKGPVAGLPGAGSPPPPDSGTVIPLREGEKGCAGGSVPPPPET
ncbi:MAG: hypothetical protein LUQ41_01305 [Methanomicrobiales archaeon]|nr:hypothetical protein [Methanomicrobiales archaeon]